MSKLRSFLRDLLILFGFVSFFHYNTPFGGSRLEQAKEMLMLSLRWLWQFRLYGWSRFCHWCWQFPRAEKIVKEEDTDSFMIVTSANEIFLSESIYQLP